MSQQTTTRKPGIIQKLYERYEPLALMYARKVYESEKIGFEFEDLVQEFKIKIYTSLISYAAKWQQYKDNPNYKPMPLEYYIKSALANRVKDFIKQITETPFKAISIEQDSFDYSVFSSMEAHVIINSRQCVCEINGVDLLQGLEHPLERRCFIMFLRGYTMGKLHNMFKKRFDARTMIKTQIALLQNYKQQLLGNSMQKYFNYELADSEN